MPPMRRSDLSRTHVGVKGLAAAVREEGEEWVIIVGGIQQSNDASSAHLALTTMAPLEMGAARRTAVMK